MESLSRIVSEKDLVALERFCLRRTYREVREVALATGVDLGELEELLASL